MGQKLHKITGINGIMHVYDDYIEIEQDKKTVIRMSDLKTIKLENNILVLEYSSDCCNFEISPEKNKLAARIVSTINDLIEKTSQKNLQAASKLNLGIDIDKLLDEFYEDETAVPLKVRELTGISLKEAERITGDALRCRGVETKLGIPLNWHIFVCYISMPLGILRVLGEWIASGSSAMSLWSLFAIAQISLNVMLMVGLSRFKKYGYTLLFVNFGFNVLFNIVSLVVWLIYGGITPEVVGSYIGTLVFWVPTIIYYRKRKILFRQ